MKQKDWPALTQQVRELFPQVVQIATYSQDRWLLVFEAEADNFLATFQPLRKLIRKHRLKIPLIISRHFIETSLDSYPLEFLDIQSDYKTLYATEDVIQNLKFDNNDIRLQIEREISSKWLLTRLTSLRYNLKASTLFRLLKRSQTALLPVLKGFCHLGGKAIPKDTPHLIDAAEEVLRTDFKIMRYIHEHKKAPSLTLIHSLFNDYIRLLDVCEDIIDTWEQA